MILNLHNTKWKCVYQHVCHTINALVARQTHLQLFVEALVDSKQGLIKHFINLYQ